MRDLNWIEEPSTIEGDPSTWYLIHAGRGWKATVEWIRGDWTLRVWGIKEGFDRMTGFASAEEAKAMALVELRMDHGT
jgi:hypothetical protein